MRPLLLLISLASLANAAGAGDPVAGSVVRSKEWVIRRGAQKEEEFKGDVRYVSGGTRLNSDWALFKHGDRTWQAKGSVVVHRTADDGVEFEARGERAGADEATKRGFMEPAPGGRVTFTRTPPGDAPDRGEAGRVSWDGEKKVTLSAGAKVWGPRVELAADQAVYERATGRLLLSGGRPVLRKVEGEWTTALKADEAVAVESPKRIEAQGKVKGWLIFKDEKKLKELAR